jgi:protein-disulfide isomerase
MKSAFSPRRPRVRAAGATSLALALALTACGSGGGNNLNQAAADLNTPLPKIAAPNNGDWSLSVVETPEGGYRMGNPEAPVKLVEYASITCPACGQFSETGHTELVNDFVKSGQVSWEFRPYSVFPTDPGLFMLLRCQGPQPFFGLTEQLYAAQREWSDRAKGAPAQQIEQMPIGQRPAAWVKATGLDQFFRQRGLPQSRQDACLADQATLQKLADIAALGQREGVTGTPTFLINGEVVGVTAWSALKPRLRAAIGS